MEPGAQARHKPHETPTHPAQEAFRDLPRVGSGWVAFAGAYLGIAGTLDLIWGITALANKSYFIEDGLVWSSLSLWGWLAIVFGAVQITAGCLLFARKAGGVVMALVLSMTGILLHFLTIGAYPVWSSVALVCNALVLWAVTVHSDEFV